MKSTSQPSNSQIYDTTPADVLNRHYRAFIDEQFSSPPPTPKDSTKSSLVINAPAEETTNPPQTNSDTKKKSKVSKNKPGKKRASREDGLTAEELALDLSSDADGPPATGPSQPSKKSKVSMNKPGKKRASREDGLTAEELALDLSSDTDGPPATQPRAGSRANLSRRSLNPLPSIDPSTVHHKEQKHALANALQQGNDAKIELLTNATKWRQEFDTQRMRVDSESRNSALTWERERYFLDCQEARDAETRRLVISAQQECQAFCQKLALDGKSPAEVEAYLRLVYPDDQA
ncbi:uncharacterized protein MELLADRAFT_69966 [Melampsora larici-populina 98AG31]|uniref:Uncharacterized protein n=1 Tax=Melampsora larici-populina (strain 98AG31 / pathotype 3-4-7) TaxID=747676 RepID=F4SCZ4_MELLP|nr:uncharacterized protein MELLADRAFT_69966 [Melampsora larici-populina 98AG31]EGF97484.1 hypothetical protein MELLADRAFT_69966 [Melampsora larici-populina 98AG31]